MIIYNRAANAFLLGGKSFSYAMYVNEAGYLQNLHYGGKITEGDLEYLVAHVGESVSPKPKDKNADFSLDVMPSECAFYGHGDYREPTLIIGRGDGAAVSSLRYLSHELLKGAPQWRGLPHARTGGETLKITLKDEFSSAFVSLYYTVWEELDVVVRNAEIRNGGREPFLLKRAYSFCLDLPEGDYGVLRLYGTWAKERIPQTADLGHGTVKIDSLRGVSSHNINPFMGILRKGCGEDGGECYGVQLVYSGSFTLSASKASQDGVRVQGGIQDLNFGWEVKGGESFVTPQAVLCYSNEGLGGLSRSLHDFIRGQIVNPEYAFARRPIVVNNWEATYFQFDNEKLFPIIDEAAKLGVDTFVLDDGWFGKRDSDTSGLGDWVVNEKKLQGGLKTIISRCKEKGLKFGLWFEPEAVSEDSDLYRAHPDWAIHKTDVRAAFWRNQLVLDFTRKEVVDYVFGAVSKVLAENEISYVKWDMNRNVTEFYSESLPANRQGEFAHRYMLGVYDLAERLTSAFPNVFFEGCAGGGGRFDAGMLYYFPQIWTSDDTDGYERTKIQWGTSLCYPASAMSCHVSACPNHQTLRITPFETRGAIASLGATGYELDLSKITEEEKREAAAQIKAYKQIDDLVLNGDLYRLADPFTGNYFCMMLVSKDKSRAYVVGERIHGDPSDYNRVLRFKGLDGNKRYRIAELDLTASGKALQNAGVLFPRLADFGAWVWHIEEVK